MFSVSNLYSSWALKLNKIEELTRRAVFVISGKILSTLGSPSVVVARLDLCSEKSHCLQGMLEVQEPGFGEELSPNNKQRW